MATKSWKTTAALTSAAALTLATALTAPAADAKQPPVGTTTAKALVFIPNPVQSSGDESLTDQDDSATAVPQSDYYEVTLTDLDGSGYLKGTWANVRSNTGPAAYSTDGTYFYNRNDDRFEQVMSYFWGTETQKYLQSLGFGSELPAVNAESQDYKVDQYGGDNSFEIEKRDTITLGKGGADELFRREGVPTTFLLTSFYWDNFIFFGAGPQKLPDGNLALVFPMDEKRLPGIAAEDIGKALS